jgi:hypothetical protein
MASTFIELPDEPTEAPEVGALEGLKRGAKYSALKASRGLADTAAWLGSDYVGKPLKQWAMSKGLVPSDEQLGAAKRATEEAGGWGTVGQIGTDVGTQLLPAGMASKAMQVGGKVAPFFGEIASNTALGAAFAPDAEKADAAAGGALGAVGGRVLAKAVGGPLRNAMTKDAKTLVDAGITLPPGQMIAGTGAGPLKRTMTGAEAGLSRIPLLGAPIKYRIGTAIEDYNKQQLNDILEPFGKQVTAGGRAGIEEARNTMEQVFQEAAPNLHIPDTPAAELIDNFITQVKQKDVTINDRVAKTIRDVLELELTPHVAQGDIPGEVGYQLGKKLDWYAKKYQGSPSPDHKSLNTAFKDLRDKWYNLMTPNEGADPAYQEVIQELQKSKRRWMNMRDAAEMTTEGFFTPTQVIKANKGYVPDEVTRAASHIMPKVAPEINVGSNALIHKLVTPGGVSGAAALGSYTGLGALTPLMAPIAAGAAAYTRPVAKYLEKGVTPAVNMLRPRGKQLTPEELEFATQLMTSQGLRALRGSRSEE